MALFQFYIAQYMCVFVIYKHPRLADQSQAIKCKPHYDARHMTLFNVSDVNKIICKYMR